MDYSWRNLSNINQQTLKMGMLSPPEDVIAAWLLFGSLPHVNKFLELGSYIGGGLGIFNQALVETGHVGVEFTGVDHLDFIGTTTAGAWYADHFNRCLTAAELDLLKAAATAQHAETWIKDRTARLTGNDITLKCIKDESELDRGIQYDIIHHDYGDSVADNLATIRNCLPLLNDDGVYIVDDWCTGAPLRTWATFIAQQEGLIYPVMWGKNKVFFAKSAQRSQELVNLIQANPECNRKLFKLMPGSDYFGPNYKTIRMHWQAMQWS